MASPIKVLIVDDHPLIRQGLASVLNAEEDIVVVGEGADGLEAVAAAHRLRPDVILMDLQMPNMDGVDAIHEIKSALPDIGIITLTTFETDEFIFRAIEAGTRGYLLKDSPPEEIVRAIRIVSMGESLIEPRVASRLIDRLGRKQSTTAPITEREVEVLRLMAKGSPNKEIAGLLLINESTVKTHVLHILEKLEVRGRTEAVVEAVRRGIINL
jgi:DNA-binding NarL/FixJ family response regulator